MSSTSHETGILIICGPVYNPRFRKMMELTLFRLRQACIKSLLCIAGATCAIQVHAQTDIGAPWLAQPYTYTGDRQPLTTVLRDFGRQFGLNVRVASGISGIVNGRVSAESPGKFLEQLGGLHGFDWFVDSGTLYVTPLSARIRRMLKVPPPMIAQVRSALQGLGLFNPRYGWGELGNQGQIIVSGPPAYVARIEEVIRNIASTPNNVQVAVYRLKYANVQDRTIKYRDREIVVPGVATILRGLEETGATSVHGEDDASSAESEWGSFQRSAVIASDIRLNAIIVKASPDAQPFYRQLISQLDVNVPLVQIEVAILDIDSDLAENIGVNWALGNIASTAAGVAAGVAGAPFSAALTTVLPRGFDLSARVHLLEKEGRGQVISKPSLLTMDNLQALFDTSETSYIRTVGERVVETTPVSAGLMLKVTPRVIDTAPGEQRRILLQVDIEDGKRMNSTAEELPVLKTSTISTQAVIGDAESLLIAGHQRQEQQRSVERVPVLGSLPGIGALFRNTHDSQLNRTRFFVVTPRIVNTLSVEGTAGSDAFRQSQDMGAGIDTTQPLTLPLPALKSQRSVPQLPTHTPASPPSDLLQRPLPAPSPDPLPAHPSIMNMNSPQATSPSDTELPDSNKVIGTSPNRMASEQISPSENVTSVSNDHRGNKSIALRLAEDLYGHHGSEHPTEQRDGGRTGNGVKQQSAPAIDKSRGTP